MKSKVNLCRTDEPVAAMMGIDYEAILDRGADPFEESQPTSLIYDD